MAQGTGAPKKQRAQKVATDLEQGTTPARRTTIGGSTVEPPRRSLKVDTTTKAGQRQRFDSSDSTRGAFYHDDDFPKSSAPKNLSELRHRKHKKKKGAGDANHTRHSVAAIMQSLDPLASLEEDKVAQGKEIANRLLKKASGAAKKRRSKMSRMEPSMVVPIETVPERSLGRSESDQSDDYHPSGRLTSFFFTEQAGSPGKGHHKRSPAVSNGRQKSYESTKSYGSTTFDGSSESLFPAARERSLQGAAFLDQTESNEEDGIGAPLRQSQQEEINFFASMARGGGNADVPDPPPRPTPRFDNGIVPSSTDESDNEYSYSSNSTDSDSYTEGPKGFFARYFDPSDWLIRDARYDENSEAYFDGPAKYTMAAFVRHFFYNPLSPEFTSLQQFIWAIVLGVVMGFYTSVWKWFIEYGVDFLWETVPERLLEWGIFTDVKGGFPLYHYMWITPAIFGGLLSWVFVVFPIPIPDQNSWITSVHSRGIQDHRSFFPLFFLSTVGMWSGLSLGPELPLVLTAGMVGSYLALITKQSMLQARVLNLTAASAAVGGFFGFPMAGALFVLEIPHRMGLQYFEALSPGTIASIIAVLTNRLVTGNDVTGYFKYPFLTSTLPSSIFTYAVFYGFYGCLVGTLYAHGTKFFKTKVHDWFHASHNHDVQSESEDQDEEEVAEQFVVDFGNGESKPLLIASAPPRKKKARPRLGFTSCFSFVIPSEPKRATVAGTIAGALVGIVGIYLPHTMFWGEAQLQNLIDKGRTPLPVFGEGDAPTAAFTHYALCMIDNADEAAIRAGFSLQCSALIMVSKTVVIGLSLGTGIVGGHFWGPLYIGCAASHLLTDVVKLLHSRYGWGEGLAMHPCVVILCTMGAAHVVTYRAHMAIMLILTLTISAFDPATQESNSNFAAAGDYSAVFPLLVVAVFISLMASRDTVFYNTQRSRGDITAVPEVLCQPGMEGAPLVIGYDHNSGDSSYDGDVDVDGASIFSGSERAIAIDHANKTHQLEEFSRALENEITQNDIEREFAEATGINPSSSKGSSVSIDNSTRKGDIKDFSVFATADGEKKLTSARLDELLGLADSADSNTGSESQRPKHRRSQSAPFFKKPRSRSGSRDWGATGVPNLSAKVDKTDRDMIASGNGSQQGLLVQVVSFGDIKEHQHQPSLLDQARMRASSSVVESRHRRIPSIPSNPGRHKRVTSMSSSGGGRHSRKSSDASVFSSVADDAGGALSLDDIEQSFSAMVNVQVMGNKSPWSNNNHINQS